MNLRPFEGDKFDYQLSFKPVHRGRMAWIKNGTIKVWERILNRGSTKPSGDDIYHRNQAINIENHFVQGSRPTTYSSFCGRYRRNRKDNLQT